MNDEEIHRNKLPGKTYISPRIETRLGPLRIASKVLDSEGLHFAKENSEVVLRRTPTGRTEIIATYLEDDRSLTVVTIQAFNGKTGSPQSTHFSFVGSEIPNLLMFFENIANVEFKSDAKINARDSDLVKSTLTRADASHLVQQNEDLFSLVLGSEITKEDIVALGYRKKQLGAFERLLTDRDFFDEKRLAHEAQSDEALWQVFFERNQWVFGYGLSYFFVTGFDNRKLEQVVAGHDLVNRGKRSDGLMKSRGIVNALCFVEIKTHETKLLGSAPYRPGCWAPSRELSGAVAQVQGTVASAMRNLYGLLRPKDYEGTPTGEEVFNFRPRSFIVVGSLGQFVSDTGVNEEQLRSFELYRNSIVGVDILTFDELFERTKFIVDAAASAQGKRFGTA